MGSGQTEATTPAAASSSAATTTASAESDKGQQQGRQDSPGRPTAAERQEPLSEREGFRISLVRNANYHEDRELFFARIHRLTMFVVVVSGSASFTFVNTTTLGGIPVLAAIITLAGLIDLVFDVSGKARLHASLRRRVYDVLAQTEDQSRGVMQLKEQAVRIYADEPPTMNAVNALAFNTSMLAFGRSQKKLLKIAFPYRFLRHWFSFAWVKFETFEEIEAAKSRAPIP
jgi:hypothetical protein